MLWLVFFEENGQGLLLAAGNIGSRFWKKRVTKLWHTRQGKVENEGVCAFGCIGKARSSFFFYPLLQYGGGQLFVGKARFVNEKTEMDKGKARLSLSCWFGFEMQAARWGQGEVENEGVSEGCVLLGFSAGRWLAISHSRTKNGEENMCQVAG